MNRAAGRHVEVRLIGAPSHVEAVYQQIARVLSASRGTKKPTRDRDGRVIQHATVTAPEPELYGIGPRRVGGRYYCGYWRNEYTVLAIDRPGPHVDDHRGDRRGGGGGEVPDALHAVGSGPRPRRLAAEGQPWLTMRWSR